MIDWKLERNPLGRLRCIAADGQVHDAVLPVRAFPIAAPEQGLSLLSADGHELAWIDDLADLPANVRSLIESELASREFMPQIQRIVSVSSYATPSTWHVETSRGDAQFVLKGEDDIRRLANGMLLIADAHGIDFLLRDISALDRGSRKILDRFL